MGTSGIFQYFFGKKKPVVNMIIFYYKHFLYMLYKFLCLIPSRAIAYYFFCNENNRSQFCKKVVTYCNMIRFCLNATRIFLKRRSSMGGSCMETPVNNPVACSCS